MSAATAAPSARISSTTPPQNRPISRNLIKSPKFPSLPLLPSPLSHRRHHLAPLRRQTSRSSRWRRTAVFVSGEGADGIRRDALPNQLSFDALLSVAELLCVVPPAVYSIGCLVGSVVPGGLKVFQVHPGSRVFVVQLFLLAVAVAIGGIIRRQQWRRICWANSNRSSVDLIARIEKVEEDLRSSGVVVRVLSRQLEKLGIRFRVTRKALKEPIAETAALAQKNSEVTRALAMQEDILEKELGEIQKVLLAMQEQQQKQLELIIAIGKAGRLFDTKRDVVTEQVQTGTGGLAPEKEEVKPLEIQTGRHTGSKDRA